MIRSQKNIDHDQESKRQWPFESPITDVFYLHKQTHRHKRFFARPSLRSREYLGLVISLKLGWGKFLHLIMFKVRQRVSVIKAFELFGCSSPRLRKTLFSSFVLPIFTWIYPIFPLLTAKQQKDLSPVETSFCFLQQTRPMESSSSKKRT